MKAAYIEQPGGPEQILVGERPDPTPGPEQVLIQVRAAGVGPWDWKMMSGMFGARPMPMIPGLEVAGVVRSAPAGSGLEAGDAVIAALGFAVGGFAELAVADAGRVAPKPASVSFEESVALVAAAGTAHEALVTRLDLQPGESVVIVGASGGLGTAGVQIAAALGARAFGVASGHNHDYVLGLGAEAAIDYSTPGWSAQLLDLVPGGVDAIFDAAGGPSGTEGLKAVRPGGRGAFVAYPPPGPNSANGITPEFFSVNVDQARLLAVGALVDAGNLRVELARVYPLEQARAAVEEVKGGHTRGKIALSVP